MNNPTAERTTRPALSAAFDAAVQLALEFHRHQERKGTKIPYLGHLFQVAGLVMEGGGDEEQAMAALLHDSLEDAETDAEASRRHDLIRRTLGNRVADLVEACTDGRPDEKAANGWKERKRRYLQYLRDEVPDDVVLISVADKLHNATAILRDYRKYGEDLWKRFKGRKTGTLWYYRALVGVYRSRGSLPYVNELDSVVRAIETDSTLGSRKHVLNWVGSAGFLEELNAMIEPVGASIGAGDFFQPRGWHDPEEAKLGAELARRTGGLFDADPLASWWLAHRGRANVPNWDILATCRVGEQRGLLLVEAKAHVDELNPKGKAPPSASARSRENHDRIGAAIREARDDLRGRISPDVNIARDVAYQFSNRIAHAWWLARHGTPVVLLYLGFVGDAERRLSFIDDAHWREAFRAATAGIYPKEGFERWIDCEAARFSVLVRSAPVPADSR